MIFGVGIDIVQIDRIKKILSQKSADSFLKKIASTSEIAQSRKIKNNLAQYWANRYAVKEAAAKALGTGFGKNFSPSEFIISSDNHGKPIANTIGKLNKLIKKLNIHNIHISMSHESNSAIAIVIFEKR